MARKCDPRSMATTASNPSSSLSTLLDSNTETLRHLLHLLSWAWLPTEQHNNRIRLGRNETQQKHIAAATIVALQNRISQGTMSCGNPDAKPKDLSTCNVTSLCFARTRWLMMCAPEVFPNAVSTTRRRRHDYHDCCRTNNCTCYI